MPSIIKYNHADFEPHAGAAEAVNAGTEAKRRKRRMTDSPEIIDQQRGQVQQTDRHPLTGFKVTVTGGATGEATIWSIVILNV